MVTAAGLSALLEGAGGASGGAVRYGSQVASPLDPACDLIGGLHAAAEAMRQTAGREPRPGSQAAEELEALDGFGRQAVHTALNLAHLRLLVAEDHLEALADLVRSSATVFSIYTVARSTVEIAARAWCLLDPGESPQRRAQLGLSEWLYSLREQANLGVPDAEPKARRRMDEIARKAPTIPVSVKRKNGMPHVGGRPAYATTLLGDVFEGEETGDLGKVVYRWLSAFSHGTYYALTQQLSPTDTAAGEGQVWAEVGTNPTHQGTVLLSPCCPTV